MDTISPLANSSARQEIAQCLAIEGALSFFHIDIQRTRTLQQKHCEMLDNEVLIQLTSNERSTFFKRLGVNLPLDVTDLFVTNTTTEDQEDTYGAWCAVNTEDIFDLEQIVNKL